MSLLNLLNNLTDSGKKAFYIAIFILIIICILYLFSAEISKGWKRAYDEFSKTNFSDESEYDSNCVPEPGEPCKE
ncbi:MAG: hypothetical protein SH817_08665 [Leptospira sp.]|nr:hypothetical protein [Leptospira sp.]